LDGRADNLTHRNIQRKPFLVWNELVLSLEVRVSLGNSSFDSRQITPYMHTHKKGCHKKNLTLFSFEVKHLNT
jgi:hypothetical protein